MHEWIFRAWGIRHQPTRRVGHHMYSFLTAHATKGEQFVAENRPGRACGCSPSGYYFDSLSWWTVRLAMCRVMWILHR